MSRWEAIKAQASAAVRRELGETILYHYREGNSQRTCAIFTIADVQVNMGGLRRCDMQRRPRQGDLITRRDVTYEIKQVAEMHDATFNCLLLAVDSRHGTAVRSHT